MAESERNTVKAIAFANDDILIITEHGDLATWKTEQNKCTFQPKFLSYRMLKTKIDVTCMSVCPHSPNLIAIGLRTGLVILADLNRTQHSFCKIICNLKAIYCISWCPAPFNVQDIKEKSVVYAEPDENEQPESLVRNEEPKTPIERHSGDSEAVKNEVDSDTDNDVEKEINLQTDEESNVPMSSGSAPANGNERTTEKISSTKCDNDDGSSDRESDNKSEISPAKGSTKETAAILDWNTLIELSEEERRQRTNNVGANNLNTSTSSNDCSLSAPLSNQKSAADENVITDCEQAKNEQEMAIDDHPVKSESENEVSFGCDIIKYRERAQEDITTPKVKNNKNAWMTNENGAGCDGVSSLDKQIADIKNIQRNFESYLIEHKQLQQHSSQKNRKYRTILDQDPSTVKNSYIFLVGSHFELQIWDALNPRKALLTTRYKPVQNRRGANSYEFVYTPAVWTNERTIAFAQGYQIRYFDIKTYEDVTSMRTHLVVHQYPIYALTTPFKYVSFEDLKHEEKKQKQEAILWSLDTAQYLSRSILFQSFNRVTSFLLCKNVINRFSISPHNNMNVAFCTQSNFIYLWKIHPSNPFEFSMIPILIKPSTNTTVLCIVYHPSIENCVAVSTSAGTIKLLYVTDAMCSKTVDVPEKRLTEVYSLSWGPFEGRTCLFAVVGGKIRIYDPDRIKDTFAVPEFVSINNATTVSWSPDQKMLALGLNDGRVNFYNASLRFMKRSYICTSFIFKLIWHGSTLDDEKNTSPLRSAIAFVAKEPTVYVCDPRRENNGDYLVASLVGHEHYVYDASWSPFQSNLLVTASADYTAKVWDVSKAVQLASFNNHLNELYSVCWMPNHPDFIMSSGLDMNLRFWNYKNYPPCFDALDLRKKRLKKPTIDLSIVGTKEGETHNGANDEHNECDHNKNGEDKDMLTISVNANDEKNTEEVIGNKEAIACSKNGGSNGRNKHRKKHRNTNENENVTSNNDLVINAKRYNNNGCALVDGSENNNAGIPTEISISGKPRSKNERRTLKDSRLLTLCYDNSQDTILDAAEALLKPESHLKNPDNVLHKFFSDNYDDVYDFMNLEREFFGLSCAYK